MKNPDKLFTAAFVAIVLTVLICITAIFLGNANVFWAIIAVPAIIGVLTQNTKTHEHHD